MKSFLARGQWLVAGLILVVLVLMCLPALQTVQWLGQTDLEVEFLVIDGTTGKPVPGAIIEVHSEGGFYEEGDVQDFALTADSESLAG